MAMFLNKPTFSTVLYHLPLSFFAGCAGVAVGHPLDTVKVSTLNYCVMHPLDYISEEFANTEKNFVIIIKSTWLTVFSYCYDFFNSN